MAQLLRSSSVAVSTSQDFDDKATITAFWKDKTEKKDSDPDTYFYTNSNVGKGFTHIILILET